MEPYEQIMLRLRSAEVPAFSFEAKFSADRQRRNFLLRNVDRADYFFDAQRPEMHCVVQLRRDTEGPPGVAHGGLCASLIDHAMSAVLIALGETTNVTVHVRAWEERREERKRVLLAEVRAADDAVCTKGRGVFLALRPDSRATYHAAEAAAADANAGSGTPPSASGGTERRSDEQ